MYAHASNLLKALQAASGVGSAGRTAQVTRQLMHGQGLAGLYRGLTPAVLGAGPAHALYYAVYEQTKAALGAGQPGQRPATVAAAGASLSHAAGLAILRNRPQAHIWPSIYISLVVSLRDVSGCGSPFCGCLYPQLDLWCLLCKEWESLIQRAAQSRCGCHHCERRGDGAC